MRKIALSIIALALCAAAVAGPDDPPDFDKLSRAINRRDAQAHVDFLASDELKGRDSPSEGLRAAARYIATEFKRHGLSPANEGSWFQDFDLAAIRPTAETKLVVENGDDRQVFDLRDRSAGGAPFDFSGQGSASGEVVFVGYGITSEDAGYDDYAGIDVTGKIVLMFRYAPNRTKEGSFFADRRRGFRYQTFNAKYANAVRHGAAGMLLVTGPKERAENIRGGGGAIRGLALDADRPRRAGRGGQGGQERARIPAAHITRKAAAALLAGSGASLEELEAQIDSDDRPRSRVLKAAAALTIGVETEKRPTRNVVGFLEGADPKLKDELVVIGAHYDHVGVFGSGADTIHNGADDNASGTAALIEVAKAFGRARLKPRRSVLFMAFAAEERGLLGSRYYCERPLFPLDKTVTMLNLDMVGRNKPAEVTVMGAKQSDTLSRLVQEANKGIEYRLDFPQGLAGNSDHASFYRKDIPVLFFTTGLHPDYHRVTDHPEKIDAAKISDIARLCYRTAAAVAYSDIRPDIKKAPRRDRRPQPRPDGKKPKLY